MDEPNFCSLHLFPSSPRSFFLPHISVKTRTINLLYFTFSASEPVSLQSSSLSWPLSIVESGRSAYSVDGLLVHDVVLFVRSSGCCFRFISRDRFHFAHSFHFEGKTIYISSVIDRSFSQILIYFHPNLRRSIVLHLCAFVDRLERATKRPFADENLCFNIDLTGSSRIRRSMKMNGFNQISIDQK